MKEHWRKAAALLPKVLEKKIYRSHFTVEHKKWLKQKIESPLSHFAKQVLIKRAAEKFGIRVLVETGTYLGDMVYAMQDEFNEIVSIELSPHFYKKAVDRFAGVANVKILQGDSGAVLKQIVPGLKRPVLFWLDGHYSGGHTAKGEKECPIFEELQSILFSPYAHVVLVDDARLFVGENDYPTATELEAFVQKFKPQSQVVLDRDIFIILFNNNHV